MTDSAISNQLNNMEEPPVVNNQFKPKNTFEEDLIYTDGSSFIENIETILNHSAPTISGKFALTNNNRVIRSELKRINYWSKN